MSDSESSELSSASETEDIFHKMMNFLDTHSEKFKDSEYKDMVESLAKAKKHSTNFWRVTVFLPGMADDCTGCINWTKSTCTVALNSTDETLVKQTRFIHPYMLTGLSKHTIHENDLFCLHTVLLPISKMEPLDPNEEFKYPAIHYGLL